MFPPDASPSLSGSTDTPLFSLMELVVTARDLNELAAFALPELAAHAAASGAFLLVEDAPQAAPRIFQHGLDDATVAMLRQWAAGQGDLAAADPAEHVRYRLSVEGGDVGVLGLVRPGELPPYWGTLINLLGHTARRLIDDEKEQQQLAHLNTYLSVSSMLAQELGLHDLLEAILYSCMEVVSAEAASVLLLDDEQEHFRFYEVEGPARPLLMTATFPVGEGLAGHVLRAGQSEVVDDVHGDPRFYEQVDASSGFDTRNMIAVPLIAGEEPVGVLEVLNKVDGGSFTHDEHMLLQLVAEEIAFAVRNAMIFEYVVDSYCLQRQGKNTCRGCKRPLGSWTPCVKYREAMI